MKKLYENWRRFLFEALDLMCPPATQDLELNTRNRNSAIEAKHIQYGPMNLADEKYWVRIAQFWNTEPPDEWTFDAKNSTKCGAFRQWSPIA